MRAVWLVARREIRERLRARSFLVATLISAGLVVAAIVIPATQRGNTPTYDVGLLAAAPGTEQAIRAFAPVIDVRLRVRSVADENDARQSLRRDELDIVAVGTDRILLKRPLDPDDTGTKAQIVAAISNVLRVQRLGPQALSTLMAPVTVNGVEPAQADAGQRATAFFGVLILFVFLQQYGQWVLLGVIEEKASRVVEVLLSAIRPQQLVGGKVLGIGLVGFLQGTIVAVSAIVASRATGTDVFEGSSRFLIAWTLAWFALGYSLYVWAFAAVGSLASRQADAQNVAFPIMIPMLVGYISATSLVSGGDPSAFVRVLAFIPFTAPTIMPMLIGTGNVAAWEIAVSVALTVGTLLLLMRAAGAIYARAILHTGRTLKLSQVLRRDFNAA